MSGEQPRSEHEGCGEDAAAYVLGALTEPEHEAFLVQLRTCSSCREEVAALQVVVNSLPAAVTQMRAPERLRGSVLATVKSEASLRLAGESREPRASRAPAARRRWGLAFGGLAGTAAAVLVAILSLGSPGAPSVKLIRAQVTAPRGSATLAIASGRGQLRIAGLPQTQPRHVYEVWLERSGSARPTSALFTVSRAGDATVEVPGSLAGVSAVMVTAEPAGGSRAPTTLPVFVAHLA